MKNTKSIESKTGDYKTTDLGLATALNLCGFSILDVDKTKPSRCVFIFEYSEGIEDCAKEYYADDLQVSVREFFDELKMLKNIIYSPQQ